MAEQLTYEQSHVLIRRDEIDYPGLEGVTYSELFERYTSCNLGEHHAKQPPRYANKYAYDYDRMLVDLGEDVHPTEHGRYTHNEIVVPLLYAQNCSQEGESLEPFSRADIVALRIAALIHDFGECEHPDLIEIAGDVAGDVVYGSKTAEHDAIEASIRDHIKDMLYGDIPDDLWVTVDTIITEADESLPSRAFSLAEHIGYYLTGMRASYLAAVETMHRLADDSRRNDDSFEQLRLLGIEVTTNHRHNTIPARLEGLAYGSIVLQHTTALYEITQNIILQTTADPAVL